MQAQPTVHKIHIMELMTIWLATYAHVIFIYLLIYLLIVCLVIYLFLSLLYSGVYYKFSRAFVSRYLLLIMPTIYNIHQLVSMGMLKNVVVVLKKETYKLGFVVSRRDQQLCRREILMSYNNQLPVKKAV